MRRFKGECEHFSFNKCPIYTHDGAKFSTNSHETDNSVVAYIILSSFLTFKKVWIMEVLKNRRRQIINLKINYYGYTDKKKICRYFPYILENFEGNRCKVIYSCFILHDKVQECLIIREELLTQITLYLICSTFPSLYFFRV